MESWIGPALQLLGLVVGGGLIAGTMRNQLQNLQGEVKDLRRSTEKLNEVVTALAVQTERINAQDKRIDMLDRRYEELRHGEGMVFPLATALRGPT